MHNVFYLSVRLSVQGRRFVLGAKGSNFAGVLGTKVTQRGHSRAPEAEKTLQIVYVEKAFCALTYM